MFDSSELGTFRKGLAHYAAGFDPALLTAAAAEAVVKETAAIVNIATTIQALAAARAAECSTWKRDGSRSPAEHLARQTGVGVGQAKELLATGEHLGELEGVAAAARAGELSPQQTAAIAGAAAANPGAEERLLAASKKSLRELKDHCAAAKAAADPDPDATHKRIHASRSCRRRRTADGGGEIVYGSTLDEIAEVWAVITGYANAEFHRARAEGRREPHDAYAADGMLAMARAAARPEHSPRGSADWDASADTSGTRDGTPGSPGGQDSGGGAGGSLDHGHGVPTPTVVPDRIRPPKPIRPDRIIVRIDWAALLRGCPIDGETCEIAGLGPVPVSVVRAMMATGDPFLAAVVTKGHDVATVAHIGRKPTAYQDTALLWRDPYCTNIACGSTIALERDHRADWAKTHITLLGWMDRLCDHDHDLKTRHGWALVDGAGRRAFVPPDHPDHPNNAARDPVDARAGPGRGVA